MEGARVSKGTVVAVVVVSAASFIVNSRISQAHLGAGFLPVRCGKLGTRRRNGDERFCSDPGRAHWEGPDDGEEIESIRFPLSLLRPVALCVYLVDKFWRKMTMTTIITRAAVVLVRKGDRRPRPRGGRRDEGEAEGQGRFVFTRQEFSGTLVEGRLWPRSSVNHHYREWIAS